MYATAQIAALLPIPALAFVALTDLVSRRVPNPVCAFIAGFGLATRIASGDALLSVLLSSALFAALFFFWTRRWIGGGDVKLLPACALLVPADAVSFMVAAVALAGGLLALSYLPGRFRRAPRPAPPAPGHAPAPAQLSCVRRILRVEGWAQPPPRALAVCVRHLRRSRLHPCSPHVFTPVTG